MKNIYELFLGEEKKGLYGNASIVKVNNENLSKHGDLCFLNNLETWMKIFPDDFQSISRSRTLLDYYLARNGIEVNDGEDGTGKVRNIKSKNLTSKHDVTLDNSRPSRA